MNEKSAKPTDPRIEAALQEYLGRLERGEVVEREAFLARYPDIADSLRGFIAAEDQLRMLAGDKASRESAGISTRSFAAQGQETIPPKSSEDRSPATAGGCLQAQFGRYEIIRSLGRGAMGAVYLAKDSQLKRNVAIKTPHFEDDPTGELLKRFYREAEAAATLLHANICPVYDVGEIDGKHFISMAYIEGRPLSDLIRDKRAQSERHIVIAVHKLARALQQAHDHDIVHRDIKPANIMINRQGEPIIMDFGLARKRRAEGEVSLTHSGVLLGSPAYMSPEQIEGDPDNVGAPSDQYSMGVVLYEMLTGQLPFRGSVVNVLAQILTKDLTRPSELRPGIDARIEAACLKMMAKKASDRFPSMKAVADELYAILKAPAATSIDAEKSPGATRPPAALVPSRGDSSASQLQNSLKQKGLTASDVTSLEELIRKCLRRRDYDQVIQIVERIPEERRTEVIQTLLVTAREKADEIAFLICEIDEADRREDGQAALKKAEELLKIKPGHHRSRAIQEKYSGYAEGGAARIGAKGQPISRWNEGGWIPWSVLAFGLAIFAVMYGVMVIYLGKTAIVIDIKDPGIEVAVKGTTLTVTGLEKHTVKVEPGEQQLKITYAGLETFTKSFEIKKGEKKIVTVSLADRKIAAQLEDAPLDFIRSPGSDLPKKATTEPPTVVRTVPSPAKPTASSQAPKVAEDTDRRAAQAMLDLGARVTLLLHGQEKAVDNRSELPTDDFQLLRVHLDDKQKLTNADLAPLRGTTNLVELSLIRCPITDAGLEYFDGLTKLEILSLDGAKGVTNVGVARLKGLTGLRILGLGGTAVSDAGVAWLTGLIGLRHLNLSDTRLTDSGLAHIERLTNLEVLGLSFTRVSDAGLAHLKNLRKLTSLILWDCSGVGDVGLSYLKDLPLQILHLSGTGVTDRGLVYLEQITDLNDLILNHKITDAGLFHIRNLKKLWRFSVGGPVTNAGLVHLRGLNQLSDLGLCGTRISSAGLAELSNLPRLTGLGLDDTRVGDADLRHLKTLVKLHSLSLCRTRVTDAGLAHLAHFKELQFLNLDGARVSDAGLRNLEAMTSLDDLGLINTRVTAAGAEKLKKSLPACRVSFGRH